MSPSTTDEVNQRGQDLPGFCQRILQLLLTEPSRRLESEQSLAKFYSDSQGPEELRHRAELKRIGEERKALCESISQTHVTGMESVQNRSKRQIANLQERERVVLHALQSFGDEKIERIERHAEESAWTADAVYEALEPRPREEFDLVRISMESSKNDFEEIAVQLEALLRKAHVGRSTTTLSLAVELVRSITQTEAYLAEQRALVRQALEQLRKRPLDLILRNWAANIGAVLLLSVVAFSAISMIAGVATARDPRAMGAVAVVAVLFQFALWTWAGTRLRIFAETLASARAYSQEASRIAVDSASKRRANQEQTFRNQHRAERQSAQDAMDPKLGAIEIDVTRRRAEMLETATRLRRNSIAQLESSIAEIEQTTARSLEEAHAKYDRSMDEEKVRHEGRVAEIAAVGAARDQVLRTQWKLARDQIYAQTKTVMNLDRRLFPPWSDPSWSNFRGQDASIGAAKIGVVTVSLNLIPGALPVDHDLAWPAGSARLIHLPLTLNFPTRASLLIESGQEGREQGIALLRETILRILTALPPGRARFTILDPVGLGEGFAAFMHLADEAEFLIGERIWTDSRQIEHRLSDLCDHMETVIQKFLRNEFADLDAYNLQAGEIAEPYRFLVMADFPTGLSDIAARKLASIVNSGARCGVFTVLLRDTRQPMPPEIDIADIRSRSLCLSWKGDRFAVEWELFDRFGFTAGLMPDDEMTMAMLRRIALTAKNSRRVEVPFSAIAPLDSEMWSESTSKSISVPLGRSGATRLQSITLGVGTSQHALIAGKTGSGKSTLLHALITNLALRYSPDEAELWLIDFKKGVEFRTYATNRLPHARAVAVESDREFGLSVLRGLDVELRRRGEIFRDRSVQDLAGYRRLGATECIPRTLLIVDEFQELFTEDDKVSEESALLLDRLVRQGRAFGIHVILGSQTLGGAYSIARATMGQMAVRIALQCNEADSQLILSDDNVSARLLSRPGEAIYNDAGGLVEGNNPFQVVWLPDDERDRMLARVRARNAIAPPSQRPPMIVFEGSAPALLDSNQRLQSARARLDHVDYVDYVDHVDHRDHREQSTVPLLWFGDAISIKDPTAVALRRQSGTNIMLVGQREDAALGISAGALVSLAAQFLPGACLLYLLDGTPPDDENHGRLAGLQKRLSLSGGSGGLRDAETILESATAELSRRQSDQRTQAPVCLVLVHAIHRFRSLRRNEDDFSFSTTTDTPATADRLLAMLLREGPPLGIHVMITCDGATNLARAFDRNAIREFEWRLLFQVSASDSSTLIDSPIASRLGPQRVILHSEESGTQEKFRPYAWPLDEWLDRVFPKV